MRIFTIVALLAFTSASACRTLPDAQTSVKSDAPGASDASLKNWDLMAAKAAFAIYKGPKPTDSLLPTRDALYDVFEKRFEAKRIHIRAVRDLRYAVLLNDREMAIVVRGT